MVDMEFCGLVLVPKNGKCAQPYPNHPTNACEQCGIRKNISVSRNLRFTMAILDVDYGAFVRRSNPDHSRPVYSGIWNPSCRDQNNSQITLKVKHQSKSEELIVCHLNKENGYQSKVDLHFQSGSLIEFLCDHTCSIHLTGYYK